MQHRRTARAWHTVTKAAPILASFAAGVAAAADVDAQRPIALVALIAITLKDLAAALRPCRAEHDMEFAPPPDVPDA